MPRGWRLGCDRAGPQLSALLDGELVPRQRAHVRAHVAVCGRCRAELDSLARVRTALRSLPTRQASPTGIGTANGGQGWGMPSRGRRGTLVRVGTLAAGVGAVAGVLALGGGPAPGTPVVRVPVELFVADHVMHTARAPAATPILVEGRR